MVEKYTALGTEINLIPRASNGTDGSGSRVVLIGEGTSGTASLGDVIEVASAASAASLFGEDSQLYDAYLAVAANGASDVYAVPTTGASGDVTSSTIDQYTFDTESEALDSASTLGADGVHSHPDGTFMPFKQHARLEQALVNQGIASVGEVDHTPAAKAAMSVNPRFVYVDSSRNVDVLDTLDVVKDFATDLNFARVVAPITGSVGSDSLGGYEPRVNDHRLVEVAPFSATVNGRQTTTAAAAVGQMAEKPLASSLTYDELSVGSLGVEYRPSAVQNVSGVTAVREGGVVVEGLTTSDEEALKDVFQAEIVDNIANGLQTISSEFAGTSVNTASARAELAADMRIALQDLTEQSPPLLQSDSGSPYSVSVSGGTNEVTRVSVEVQPVNVMKNVVIDLNVGSVVTLDGGTTVSTTSNTTDSTTDGTSDGTTDSTYSY